MHFFKQISAIRNLWHCFPIHILQLISTTCVSWVSLRTNQIKLLYTKYPLPKQTKNHYGEKLIYFNIKINFSLESITKEFINAQFLQKLAIHSVVGLSWNMIVILNSNGCYMSICLTLKIRQRKFLPNKNNILNKASESSAMKNLP